MHVSKASVLEDVIESHIGRTAGLAASAIDHIYYGDKHLSSGPLFLI